MSLKSVLLISFLAFVLGYTIEALSSPKVRRALESSVSESISELVADIRLAEDIQDINEGRLTRGLLDLPSPSGKRKSRPSKVQQFVD